MRFLSFCAIVALGSLSPPSLTQAQKQMQAIGPPASRFDLATETPANAFVTRSAGPAGDLGFLGVPVAGGFDMDQDGHNDSAVGYFLASPLGRTTAGEVYLVFGDGTLNDAVDLAVPQNGVLRILGAGNGGTWEATGSEVWMGDVTGDGVGDLLISRQNYSPPGGVRDGAGALTILVGGPEVRTFADTGADLDLASPPPSLTLLTFVGATDFDRLGMWARVGDVDGDGIDDIAVSADEADPSGLDNGEIYVIRGGSHLDANGTIDLVNFGSTSIAGNIARIRPQAVGSDNYHFGSTLQLGDLDGNGRAEVFASAALNRAGGVVGLFSFSGEGSGGVPDGAAFIIWDDNFPAGTGPWPAGYSFALDTGTGSFTTIHGEPANVSFGEELLGGEDYDGDGLADFFVGDLVGNPGDRPGAGLGYVFYRARHLKGLTFDIDNPPAPHLLTTVFGPSNGALGSDTVTSGDFNGDGLDDLVIGSPRDAPAGREDAGTIHVIYGQQGRRWPRQVDTAPGKFPNRLRLRIVEILGANARDTGIGDEGDTLCYSAASGDLDGDGRDDIITNEMVGNGTSAGTDDAGNLVLISGKNLRP